jgi:tetratricopeptide (TPR) repeat protein
MTRLKRALVFLSILATANSILSAQAPGGAAPGAGSAPGSGNRLPGGSTPAPSGNPSNQSRTTVTPPQDPTAAPPINLYGKVAMADGSPVPNGVSIVRVCMTNQRTIAFADSKGHFSYQSGMANFEPMADASEASSPGFGNPSSMRNAPGGGLAGPETSLIGCELRADLMGFRSDVVNLESQKAFGSLDVGTIVLHRLANVEGTSVSATLYSAPPDARKAYEKGLQSLQKGRFTDSQKDLEKAVAVYPKFANAWLALGRARLKQDAPELARDAFHKALDADPKLVEAHVELGIMAARGKSWGEAAQHLDTALKLDPVDFPQIWFTDAVANFNSGNYDSAEKMAREALKVDVKHKNPQVDQLLGMALAQKHDYAGAADELRTYIRLAPDAADIPDVKVQLQKLESLLAVLPQ